jgi:hypothetical protein
MTWMKIDDACEYAGGLDRKTMYAAVKAGALTVAPVGNGRNMLFAAEWIDEWLCRRATDTAPLRLERAS